MSWGEVGGRAARVWAGALAIAVLAVGLARRDGEALAFAVATVLAAALTKVRKGLLGRIALGLLAADSLAWMAPAALLNARDGEQPIDVAVPVLLAVLSLGILLLVFGVAPATVLVAGVVLLVAGVAGAFLADADAAPAPDADVEVGIRNVAFSVDQISVAGDGVILVRNHDLFWHTFTVEELGINERLATGATRVVNLSRFDAEPGNYEFVCVIPGHEAAGMTGTLTIEARGA